jgi:ribulose-phosphate 3-epimerase
VESLWYAVPTSPPASPAHPGCGAWQSLVDDLAAAGASSVTFHWEATTDAAALAARIRGKAMRAACAIKPATPAEVPQKRTLISL